MATPTAPYEGMTLAQFAAAREVLSNALASFDRIKTDCRSCTHFDMGRCKQFGQDIPADFQKTPGACEGWTWDSIPF